MKKKIKDLTWAESKSICHDFELLEACDCCPLRYTSKCVKQQYFCYRTSEKVEEREEQVLVLGIEVEADE